MASAQNINITIGTAGHIDHGKTALVKNLTGCETDRLKEEKERGMSIELGFAPCVIDNMQVGIVDVPGHENFVKTMVAGASGMDGVLLVVAADDGVMPQTREHLEILTLLGVKHGIVALTKIDRVGPDDRDAARGRVEEFSKGTFLDGAPILPVSNVTGEGFGPFYEALSALVRSIKPKETTSVFRLPVERAFSVKGCGTVVSGIPVSGRVEIGDELVLLPQGASGEVRQIEVYCHQSNTCLAGQCAALAVRRWDHTEITRGDVAAAPGYFAASEWFACKFRLLPREHTVLETGARLKFHTGTSEITASIYLMEGDKLCSGEEVLVQVKTSRPLVAGPADRFILRTLSPMQTIGGGTIIEAIPRRLKRTHAEVLSDLLDRADAVSGEKSFVEYCVKTAANFAARESDVSPRTKLPPSRLKDILAGLSGESKIAELAPGLHIHAETAARLEQKLVKLVGAFHRQSPESPGITPEELRAATGSVRPELVEGQKVSQLTKAVFDGLVERLKSNGGLVEKNRRLALAGHQPALCGEDRELTERIEELFRQGGLHPPGIEDVMQQTMAPRDKIDRALKILIEHERLVSIEDGLFFHRQAVDKARDLLVEFIRKKGELESVKFKYLLDTTRKFALPLLDYFDRIGVTVSRGRTRFLKHTK